MVITSLLINPNRATAGTPVQGPISTDTSWTVDGSPYWVEGDVVVLSPANLTVEPGVEVLFNGLYAIYVEGVLYSVGTPASAIDYTSNLSTPSPGDWKGLQVNATGRATIRHTNITYSTRGVVLEGSSNNAVANAYVALNSDSGIAMLNESSSNLIESNDIWFNGDGIYVNRGLSSTIVSNNISFNDNGINCYYGGCIENIIAHNSISENAYHAIRMEGVGNTIRRNEILGNSFAGTRWDAYWCYGGSVYNEEAQSAVYSIGENSIANNTIARTVGIGVAVDCGGRENLESNIIRDNDGGIAVYAGSSHLDPPAKVTSHRNIIMKNGVGVELYGYNARTSSISHNDFIENTLHVIDSHVGNTYHRNFWSGYSEVCEDWWRSGVCLPYLIGFDEGGNEVIEDLEPSKFPSVWRGPPEGQWPAADAGGPYLGEVGKTIQFDGTASFDADGSIRTYYWDFGDGNFGTGPSPEWAYWWAGTFSVLLIVWDDDYMWSMCNTTATITEGHSTPHTPHVSQPHLSEPEPLPWP